jgi:GNAT superfamily N-acetyltransferase
MGVQQPIIALVRTKRQHVGELGRICFEAFKDVADHHGFTPDFSSVADARRAIGELVRRSDEFYGVAALVDGEPVGSNFLTLADPVTGVGPITVDLAFQSQGVGRALMRDVIEFAERERIERVRLMQDAFNMASLTLYASLGFEVKEAAALMLAQPAGAPDPAIRPATEADLAAIETLGVRLYKTSRRNEVASALRHGRTVLLRERDGEGVGYLVPGMFGHGIASTTDDALALVGEAARRETFRPVHFFCPLSEAELFRAVVRAGHRVVKVMNLMALGPYEPPDAVWLPSVAY